MNILYLSENDPRNTDFGGAQRTHFIWEALKRKGTVYSVFFDQQFKTEEIAPRIWHVRKLLKVNFLHYFFYRFERKLLYPLNVLPLWPIPTLLDKDISDIFPHVRFDMVVCRYCFDLMEMHLWKFPRVYVDFDDHPIEMYNTLKCRNVPTYLRPLGRLIIKKQIDFLRSRIDGGWISNPSQACMIRCKGDVCLDVLKNIALEPSCSYKVNAEREPLLMIVGAMSYYPNYTGVDKFLTEMWSKIHKKYPYLELAIVGRGAPEEYTERWRQSSNVRIMGFVDNLELIYQSCLATVVPVYSGGGTCIKTIESMSFSRVCLSSPFGARGLEDCLSLKIKGLQVFDSADSFLQVLEKYVLDEGSRAIAEKEANDYIRENYSKDAFMQTIMQTIR